MNLRTCVEVTHRFFSSRGSAPHPAGASAPDPAFNFSQIQLLLIDLLGARLKRRRLEYAFLTNSAATVRSVGAMSVRAWVRPRPWSGPRWWCRPIYFTLKVATWWQQRPEGLPAPPSGCASRPLCRVVRDSRNTLLATAPADSVETL
jgi:hypothetical protein